MIQCSLKICLPYRTNMVLISQIAVISPNGTYSMFLAAPSPDQQLAMVLPTASHAILAWLSRYFSAKLSSLLLIDPVVPLPRTSFSQPYSTNPHQADTEHMISFNPLEPFLATLSTMEDLLEGPVPEYPPKRLCTVHRRTGLHLSNSADRDILSSC